MNQTVIERTAATLGINHFHLIEDHVRTVGLCAERILDGSKLQMMGFACGFEFVATTIRGYSLKGARLVGDVVEGEKIAIFLPTLA